MPGPVLVRTRPVKGHLGPPTFSRSFTWASSFLFKGLVLGKEPGALQGHCGSGLEILAAS